MENMGSNSQSLMIAGFLMTVYFVYQADKIDQDYNQALPLMIMVCVGLFLAFIGGFFDSGSTIFKTMSLLGAIGCLFMISLFIISWLSSQV